MPNNNLSSSRLPCDLESIFNPILKLTLRESLVLNGLLSGLKTKHIAEKLLVSEKVVYGYRTKIYSKMSVRSLNELYIMIKKCDALF